MSAKPCAASGSVSFLLTACPFSPHSPAANPRKVLPRDLSPPAEEPREHRVPKPAGARNAGSGRPRPRPRPLPSPPSPSSRLARRRRRPRSRAQSGSAGRDGTGARGDWPGTSRPTRGEGEGHSTKIGAAVAPARQEPGDEMVSAQVNPPPTCSQSPLLVGGTSAAGRARAAHLTVGR
ncbi:translation initiation factor IF-2-like [Rhinolophus ferrumequinum]|uniref:translation initiation factor IF-2-like n=1 Tax=Rhinolophus ferrumequinum TaxID=59479 RepID=UPI00140F977F|nr:translation initiation factor IF-2-like [Rhinolophus ferrumequinum]